MNEWMQSPWICLRSWSTWFQLNSGLMLWNALWQVRTTFQEMAAVVGSGGDIAGLLLRAASPQALKVNEDVAKWMKIPYAKAERDVFQFSWLLERHGIVCRCRLMHPSKTKLGQGCAHLKSLVIYSSETPAQSQISTSSRNFLRSQPGSDIERLGIALKEHAVPSLASSYVRRLQTVRQNLRPLASAYILHRFTSPLHLTFADFSKSCIHNQLFQSLTCIYWFSFSPEATKEDVPALLFSFFPMASCSKNREDPCHDFCISEWGDPDDIFSTPSNIAYRPRGLPKTWSLHCGLAREL